MSLRKKTARLDWSKEAYGLSSLCKQTTYGWWSSICWAVWSRTGTPYNPQRKKVSMKLLAWLISWLVFSTWIHSLSVEVVSFAWLFKLFHLFSVCLILSFIFLSNRSRVQCFAALPAYNVACAKESTSQYELRQLRQQSSQELRRNFFLWGW